MRTVLFVIAMVLLALAAGLSFVLPAAAQSEPWAEMEFGCGPDTMLPSGETVLVSCTGVARNTGPAPILGAQLEFLPAATLPPPDFYLFWSVTHDGVRSIPGEVQLTYDLGDIEPGGFSAIDLEIIVRSTHDYGADVALVGQPDQRELGRATIRGAVSPDGAATALATLTREDDQAAPPLTSATYRLAILNNGDNPYDDVAAELSPGTAVRVEGASEWKPSGEPGRLVSDFGPLAGSATIERAFRLVSANAECATARPVMVVTTSRGGIVRRQPLVDDGLILSPCGGGDLDAGGVKLPNGGYGVSAGGRGMHRLGAMLAGTGVLCLAMGATARRRIG
jgi:hypothetical protein